MGRVSTLTLVRAAHTAIYLIMASAVFVVLYAAATGATGWWLWLALGLVGLETVVFVGNGMTCPFTALAVKYGADKDGAWDTFFPEPCTRHTLTVFGPLIALGVVGLLVRWAI